MMNNQSSLIKRKRYIRAWIPLCLAALAISLSASAFVSVQLYSFSAEAVVNNNQPAPIPRALSIQADDMVRGRDYTLTIPVLDTVGHPMANFVVKIVLKGPDGKSQTFFANTDAQGTATLTVTASEINQLGQYTVTVSGNNLNETTTEFMVLEPKKGGVAVGPNPFSPSDPIYNQARFIFLEPGPDPVTLEIYRMDGAKVFSHEFSPVETISWRGNNFLDQRVAGGIYIWQIKTGARKINGTVVVVR